MVTGLGALAAVLANPLAGALSDRTGPAGRPDSAAGTPGRLGGAAARRGSRWCCWPGSTPSPGSRVGWVAAQVCFNAMLASLTAAVPGPGAGGPARRRLRLGRHPAGARPGARRGAGHRRGHRQRRRATSRSRVVVLLLSLPFALLTADDPLPRAHRPALRLRGLLASMWISPRRHPDFAWAWFTRFLVQLGNALGTLYLLYFLDRRGHGWPTRRAALLVLILLYTLGMMLTAVVAGRLSDRSGRRKVFVIVSGLVMAVAALLLAVAPAWPMAMAAALLLGAGYGVYLAVDAALITQVLPAATDRAKDLGVINIANSAPQVLGPALSAPIVVHLGGYPDALRGHRGGHPARQRPGPQDPLSALTRPPGGKRSRPAVGWGRDGTCTLRPFPDRYVPRRRRPLGAAELDLRQAARRRVRAAHRGHRRGPQPARSGPRASSPRWTGSASSGAATRARTSSRRTPASTGRAAERLYDAGRAYYCDCTREAVQARTGIAVPGLRRLLPRPRPRPGRGAGAALPHARRGRDRGGRPDPRRADLREQADRGLRHRPGRRLAGLPARQRRRRHDHGDHPRDPGRGAPAQHPEAAAALGGARASSRRSGRTCRWWSTRSGRSCPSGATRSPWRRTGTRATSPTRCATT